MGYQDFNRQADIRPVSSVQAWRERNGEVIEMPPLPEDITVSTSRREQDLDWQIRFAKMKLRGWRDPDNPGWDPLDGLLKNAISRKTALG